MKRNSLFWAIGFALLAAGSLALYALRPAAGATAVIWLDGEPIERIELAGVALPYEFDVESDYGCNRLRISSEGVAVVWSDCPEQVCVRQGEISSPHIPITCLPHRLVVQIEEG